MNSALKVIIALSVLEFSYSANIISVYGDVYKDVEFFTKIFPFIIDNIGGEIAVDYHLLGSGRYSVPQMCALSQMHTNTFLQSQYLQCESEGHPSELCLCNSGIDPEIFKHCVRTQGASASVAALKYSQLRLEASPVVEIGPKNTVFEVTQNWYLRKICTIFGDNQPRGCIKPFSCNGTMESFTGYGIAHFDCGCKPVFTDRHPVFNTSCITMENDYYTTTAPYDRTSKNVPV